MSETQKFTLLNQIGPDFWNIRTSFKMFLGLLDIGTHMSFVRLNSGKFVAIDTIELSAAAKLEVDALTDGGRNLEAVIATHPFHTVFFRSFYKHYPNAKFYGTPRHLRNIVDIPWSGDVNQECTRKLWEPEISMRIPAGSEFVNPLPPDKNHFSNVFVFHRKSRTIHNDDTVLFSSNPGFLLKLVGFKSGSMMFHPSIKSCGLYPTEDAPTQFSQWIEDIIKDWNFDNLLSAHNGGKIGGAKELLKETLVDSQKLLQKLRAQNAGKTGHSSQSGTQAGSVPPENDDCG